MEDPQNEGNLKTTLFNSYNPEVFICHAIPHSQNSSNKKGILKTASSEFHTSNPIAKRMGEEGRRQEEKERIKITSLQESGMNLFQLVK
jgi:hypothetical protein